MKAWGLHFPAVLLAALSGLVFWWSLQWGVGLSPDSMFYLEQSGRLADQFAISAFQDKAPPLYPLTQYIAERLAGEQLQAIKLLHVLLYVLNAIVLALLVFSVTGGSRLFAMFAVVLHACSPTIYAIHSFALSEPLFITFFLLNTLFMHRYFTSKAERWLVAAGIMTGLMLLTRFASLAFLASVSLFLLFYNRNKSFSSFVRQAVKFVLSGILLPLAWMLIKVLFDVGASSPRTLQFNPVSLEQFTQLFEVFAGWLFINEFLPVFIVLSAVIVHITYLRLTNADRQFPAYLLFNAGFYCLFILTSIAFFDAYTPIDQRIFLPVLYLAMVFLLEAAHRYMQSDGGRSQRAEVAVLGILFVTFGSYATFSAGKQTYRHGQGFMSRQMQGISLHNVARDSDVQTVYTNSPELVRLYVDKTAVLLPQFVDASSRAPNDNWIAELGEVLQAVDSGSASIVYYNAVNWRTYLPTPEFLAEQYGIAPAHVSSEGAIFLGPLQ